jgi:hypothetical protein
MRQAPGALLAVLTVSFAGAALAQPNPDGTFTELSRDRLSAEEFAQVKEMMKAMGADVGPSKGGPRSEALSETPAPADLSPEALGKLTERLGRSFFFGMRMNRHLTIEGDLWFFPALAEGTLDVQWTKVVGPKGKNVLAPLTKEEAAEAAERAKAGFGGLRWSSDGLKSEAQLTLTLDADHPGIQKAEGKAKLKVPLTYTRLELPCRAGASATGDGQTATVRRCESDFVELAWGGTSEPNLVVRNAAGKRLGCVASHSMPVFAGGRTLADLSYADLPIKVEGARIACNASGKVASMVVALPKDFAERTVAVTATPEPMVDSRKVPKVAAARTLWEPAVGTGLQSTTAKAVKAGIRIQAARTYAMSDYNQPKVVVSLPRLDNSLYATIEFGEATLLDKAGRPVAHKPDSIWVSWPELSNEVRFSKEEGDGPLDFARARGTVKVSYPVAMKVVTLTRARPSGGGIKALFKGPQVSLVADGPGTPVEEGSEPPELKAPSFAPHAFDLVRAYDPTGERLRQLQWEGQYDDTRVLDFWGEPAELRLVVAEKWETLELSYDLPPAPLLPAGREGEKP